MQVVETAGTPEPDWVSKMADEVIEAAARRSPGGKIVCASGLSPSGPIHLGNLREVMTPHLVADEIRRRGHDCDHLISWDDYDRFRRVPAGIDPAWQEHVGKPLSAVPAPFGSPYDSWADHFKAPMIAALEELGVPYRGISQTEMYTGGAYRDQVLLAMRDRQKIDGILGRFRTKKKDAPDVDSDDGEDVVTSAEYFPFKPYCGDCGRDDTTITAYDDDTTEMTYTCACGAGETVLLREFTRGKLVWKVDWPMRWAYEGVHFEPSGVDHSSPGSSFQVGGLIVDEVFGGEQPIGPMYAFVGISGQAKMSSSRGSVPTPGDALEILEVPVLRWQFARRRPNQAIKVAFDQEIHRLYDEWDALERKVAAGTAGGIETTGHVRAVSTAERELPRTPEPVAYRTLASVVDITAGDPAQLERILAGVGATLDGARPRLDRATRWVETYMPDDAHTRLRDEPDTALLGSLDEQDREAVAMLRDHLTDDWSLDGLTSLVYGVPKKQAGLPLDVKPTDELKAAQRRFFVVVYQLLVGADTGPRLPTLLLAAGPERVRHLLGGENS
ncbi:lysine--tRNA ligase [Actinomycetospora flava]|uniref:Lysine--tRNA ligase n=1 Tax=Actinomycetospora flava TaxID=3129232 RepID=A0ABU8M081_9PSEU